MAYPLLPVRSGGLKPLEERHRLLVLVDRTVDVHLFVGDVALIFQVHGHLVQVLEVKLLPSVDDEVDREQRVLVP